MKSLSRLSSCLVALVLCAHLGQPSALAAAKPNIVLIMADDAAWGDFGFSRALTNTTSQFQTPNLDALAQQSAVASSYYTPVSVCSPTRAGLLTGVYPQRFGYEDNITNNINSPIGLTANDITIAQRLKPLGYSTGIVGKWHLGYINGLNRPGDKGFDESFGPLGGTRGYFQDTGIVNTIYKNNQPYEVQYRSEGDPSRYDPVNGRYVTDAFGEEAANFIDRHAAEQNPFFLYVPLTSPHVPIQAKQSDLDRFAHITNTTQRTLAAMTYATDRAVGDIVNAIRNNGIDDNTIVIFTNDNGADFNVLNPPFKGFKGTAWEGGVKVPYLIKAPGVQPSVYNAPFSGIDMMPTLVSAAGGDVSQIPHDGVDMMPFLKGESVDDPNRMHIMRLQGQWMIREGDWKLVLPSVGQLGPHLFNVKNDPTEQVFGLYLQRPDIYAKLQRDFTNWEATMAKPKWGPIGAANKNLFDHFVFRNNLAASTNWSNTNSWIQAGTNNIKSMIADDAYANGIFEFTTRNDADYVANNNMKRMSAQTFMLNEFRFTGNFNGTANRQGQLTGLAVLFVKNLSGEGPKIRLDATASTSSNFTFQIDNELQLLHDLEITGNGTQHFRINGRIRDYYEPGEPNNVLPHSLRKTGTSTVTLAGNNTFTGAMSVEQGKVIVDTASGAINGATSISVKNGAEFSLKNGLVKTPLLDVEAGGSFSVDGGRLETKGVVGSLVVNAGTFAPGYTAPAITTITDDFTIEGGLFQLEIGGANPGTGFDQLVVGNIASIAGGLQVQFTSGFSPALYQSFQIITARNLSGSFSMYQLPVLANNYSWRVLYSTTDITLTVRPPGQSNVVNPVGDFNLDGIVDAADYTVWRDSIGSTTNFSADANGDQLVNLLDYNLWKAHFGEHYNAGLGNGSLDTVGVPEPSTFIFVAITVLIFQCDERLIRRTRSRANFHSHMA
jgi:autotransporter-associated beta strand protein